MILDNLLPRGEEETKYECEQQKRKELVLLRNEKKVPGHTMFSYNLETHEIKPAKIIYSTDYDYWTRQPIQRPRLITEANCIYRQALNVKNLIKRLKREGIKV